MTFYYTYRPLNLEQEHWALVDEFDSLERSDDDLCISCLLSDISNGTNSNSTIAEQPEGSQARLSRFHL